MLASMALQLGFVMTALAEASHLRKVAQERALDAASLPSLACLLDAEEELAEGLTAL